MKNNFICDFCQYEVETLYEGWFRNSQAFNSWARGTASAGVIQLHSVCHDCLEEAISNGVACAIEMPNE
jgi:phosphoribosyl-AMP cyclohydrolase